ncbi:MAG: M28 family peptidase [Lewinellaceae bacterium]|jgi:glutaminyl-peptide cyclotransferase|nr:M28 family peptidase [Lewinellaceae bacterium]
MSLQISRQKIAFTVLVLFGVSYLFISLPRCTSDKDKPNPQPTASQPAQPPVQQVAPPAFNADSAYHFVKKQVDFGPRVPNTEAHRKCAAWIAGTFKKHGLTVIEQKFQAPHFKGGTFDCVNIIAQYNPENPRRILLAAHWDSRFQADQDTKDKTKPILGADDGGSGVGVLLEIARLLKEQPVDIGVDLICFDAEDQGNDADDGQDHSKTWCLGAQHWSKNLHRPGYMPAFGILLDMVGGANPKFQKEGISMQAAPGIVQKVWSVAASLGYSNVFVEEMGAPVTDDHYFIITNARIPIIDVISRPGGTRSGFVPHWHTHDDDMDAIDKNTLRIVGEVCLGAIYRTHNGTL